MGTNVKFRYNYWYFHKRKYWRIKKDKCVKINQYLLSSLIFLSVQKILVQLIAPWNHEAILPIPWFARIQCPSFPIWDNRRVLPKDRVRRWDVPILLGRREGQLKVCSPSVSLVRVIASNDGRNATTSLGHQGAVPSREKEERRYQSCYKVQAC